MTTTSCTNAVHAASSGRQTGTGIEDPSCCHIEALSSRIRSLLLSRNHRCPPRTPFSSDDCIEHFPKGYGSVDTSSLNIPDRVAQSVAHKEKIMSLSLPEPKLWTQRSIPRMSGDTMKRKLGATSCSSGLMDDSPRLLDGAVEHAAEDPSHLVDQPGERLEIPRESRKRFRLPRLVLQDKKKRDPSTTRSCIDLLAPARDSQGGPTNQETSPECCLPCSPIDSRPSKYIVSHDHWPFRAVHAEAADLACFLAHCRPGDTNCELHAAQNQLKRSHSVSYPVQRPRVRSLHPDLQAIGSRPADQGPQENGRDCEPDSHHIALGASDLCTERQPLSNPDSRRVVLKASDPCAKMPASKSPALVNRFPHVVQSLQQTAMEQEPQSLSATIVNNISLPGPSGKLSDTVKFASDSLHDDTILLMKNIGADANLSLSRANVEGKEPGGGFCQGNTQNEQSTVNHSDSAQGTQAPVINLGAEPQLSARNSTQQTGSVTVMAHAKAIEVQEGPLVGLDLETMPLANSSERDETVIQQEPEQSLSQEEDQILTYEFPDSPLAEIPVSPTAGHLANLKEAIAWVDNMRERMYSMEQKYIQKAILAEKKAFDRLDASALPHKANECPSPMLPQAYPRSKTKASLKHPNSAGQSSEHPSVAEHQVSVMASGLVASFTRPTSKSDLISKFRHLAERQEESNFSNQTASGPAPSPAVATQARKERHLAQQPEETSILDPVASGSAIPNTSKQCNTGVFSHLVAAQAIPPSVTCDISPEYRPLAQLSKGHDVHQTIVETQPQEDISGTAVTKHATSVEQHEHVDCPIPAPPRPTANISATYEALQKYYLLTGQFKVADRSNGISSESTAQTNTSEEIPDRFTPSADRRQHVDRVSSDPAVSIADSAKPQILRYPLSAHGCPASTEVDSLILAEHVPDERASLLSSMPVLAAASSISTEGASSVLEVDPRHAEYWGFLPAAKQTARDSTQVTSRHLSQGTDLSTTVDEKFVSYDLVNGPVRDPEQDPESYPSQATLAKDPSPLSQMSSNELESVPFDHDEIQDDQERASKISLPWGKDSPPSYSAIPSRKSSKPHVPEPRDRELSSLQAHSPITISSRRRSYEPLPSRSECRSSKTSAGSVEDLKEPMDVKVEDETAPNNPVRWLKDLLSNSESYTSHLTALPPRTRRNEVLSSARTGSKTAPTSPVTQLSPRTNPGPAAKPDTSKPTRVNSAHKAITKTIADLENLLNEAILLTRLAAGRGGPGKSMSTSEKTQPSSSIPKNNFHEESLLDSKIQSTNVPDYRKLRSSDDTSSAPSVHESVRSDYDTSDSALSDDEEVEEKGKENEILASSNSLPLSAELTTVESPVVGNSEKSNTSPKIAHNNDSRGLPAEFVLAPTNSSPVISQRSSVDAPFQRVGTKSSGVKAVTPKTSSAQNRDIPARSPGNIDSTGVTEEVGRDVPSARVRHELDEATVAPLPLPRGIKEPICRRGHSGNEHDVLKGHKTCKLTSSKFVPSKREVRGYIKSNRQPPIQPRASSLVLGELVGCPQAKSKGYQVLPGSTYDRPSDPVLLASNAGPSISQTQLTTYSQSLDGTVTNTEIDFSTGNVTHGPGTNESERSPNGPVKISTSKNSDGVLPQSGISRRRKISQSDLRGKSHISLRENKGFSLAHSHKKKKIARDWSLGRKRFCAAVACISSALIGILVGIYAGEVPSIQYYIVDFHHYTVLGNVFFFIALAIPTFLFWPLPLLHGRKPYILSAMALAMPLLFPQALAVGQFRSPYVSTWRVALILSRALMGFCLGFANMNFGSTLTDLFGASLQSEYPHQEVVDEFDVRRHGGGMGIWLGLWTWSAMGSIGVGFLVGAAIINSLDPAWGFYISIIIIASVLFLNILTPEVRRSAFRRCVAEVRTGTDVSRRLARGEVKMHMVQTGPKWWGEEFHYGVILSQKMLRQPGFLVMALYVAWIYAQVVLVIVLLGSLMSKYYKFKSPMVGLSVCALPLGAMIAIPFQSGSLFSRSRFRRRNTNDDTFNRKLHWSSHLVRRAIFVLVLPFADLGYTLSSSGPPTPFVLPILFAGLIGFLSNLAMAECHGILMESFDTSDLQPGMTGRPRGRSGDRTASKRTNYSSFPRVASAFAITQGTGYLFAALASGVGGVAERQLGAQAATGVMAGILLVLSALLLLVFARFREVQIIPDSKSEEMTRWRNARRNSVLLKEEGIEEDEEPWRPVIIGNPTHHTRRMNLLEMGGLTRWTEIRRKNRLIDEQSLEAKHPNLVALEEARERLREAEQRLTQTMRRSLSRGSSRGSRGSRGSRASRQDEAEGGDLGGHREMLLPRSRSGKGSRRRKSTIKE